MKRSSYAAILFAITFLAYTPILFFHEFVYDDVALILQNRTAHSFTHWTDLFSFVIQPTRPLSNLLLATIHWLGQGQIIWQRVASLTLHSTTVVLAYLFLEKLFRQTTDGVSGRVAFWSALFFGLHPIVSEVNAIACFRWEILGTLFLFLSGLFALQSAYVPLFLTMGLSFLCKENFIVLTPLLVISVLRLTDPNFNRRHVWRVLKLMVPWIAFLIALTRLPTAFPYREYVGLDIQADRFQWVLSVNAFVDSIAQVFWGGKLTLLRLTDKPLAITTIPTWAIVVVLALPALVAFLLSLRRTASALCLAIASANLYFYLLLPNINIGSARYYYPSLPFLMAVILVWASRFYVHRKVAVVLGAYALFLLAKTELRLMEFRSQRSIAEAENNRHPNVEFTWLALVHLYEQLPQPERLSQAIRGRLEAAAVSFPQNVYLRVQQMRMRYDSGDHDGARRVVADLDTYGLPPSQKNEVRFETVMASAMVGDCEFAKKNFDELKQSCQLIRPPELPASDRCGMNIAEKMFLNCQG